MKEVLIRGQDILKTYAADGAKTKVLDHINIEIRKGDFTVIMGASGAGKSTLLYVLSGMDKPSAGTVIFEGKEISSFSEKQMAEIRANDFGFVFQQSNLISNLTLYENIAVAGYVGGRLSEKEVRFKTESLMGQMKIDGAENHYPSQASGGEAQRAAVARAMISSPEIIFADEPTGALNKSASEGVMNLLTELNRDGQSILMVTHELRSAIRGNRIIYLEDGKIPDELLLDPYERDEFKNREEKAVDWLTSLNW